jgi:cysteinyl-tRNA synthetase
MKSKSKAKAAAGKSKLETGKAKPGGLLSAGSAPWDEARGALRLVEAVAHVPGTEEASWKDHEQAERYTRRWAQGRVKAGKAVTWQAAVDVYRNRLAGILKSRGVKVGALARFVDERTTPKEESRERLLKAIEHAGQLEAVRAELAGCKARAEQDKRDHLFYAAKSEEEARRLVKSEQQARDEAAKAWAQAANLRDELEATRGALADLACAANGMAELVAGRGGERG